MNYPKSTCYSCPGWYENSWRHDVSTQTSHVSRQNKQSRMSQTWYRKSICPSEPQGPKEIENARRSEAAIKSTPKISDFDINICLSVFCTWTWWRCAEEEGMNMLLSLKLIMGTPGNSRVGHVHNLNLTKWSPQLPSLHVPGLFIFLFPSAFDPLLLSKL